MDLSRWAWPGAAMAAALLAGIAVQAQAQVQVQLQGPLPGTGVIARGFEAAWARQPEARGAGDRRRAAALVIETAGRWTPESPALDLNAKSDRLSGNRGSREYEATLALALWRPGERSGVAEAARAEADSVEARLAALRLRTAGEVRESHWALQRALLDADLADQRLRSAARLAADVARRVSAGDLARADGHQAEAAVAAGESAQAEAAVAVSRAMQQWRALTGTVPPASISLDAEALPTGADALPLHPSLRELEARVELARRQLGLARTQTRAQAELRLGAVRERGGTGDAYGQGLVVGVRLPLGTLAGSESRIAAAGADQAEAESQLSVATQRTEAEIAMARERVRALERSAAASLRRATLARETRDFFEKSFRLGETDLPTRLRMELDAFEASRQSARAQVELAAGISQLNQALGTLPESQDTNP